MTILMLVIAAGTAVVLVVPVRVDVDLNIAAEQATSSVRMRVRWLCFAHGAAKTLGAPAPDALHARVLGVALRVDLDGCAFSRHSGLMASSVAWFASRSNCARRWLHAAYWAGSSLASTTLRPLACSVAPCVPLGL